MAVMIRSVVCRLVNESDRELVMSSEALLHGSYDAPPPGRVAAGSSAEWRSSTCGFMTGTEGRVAFGVAGTEGKFEVYWDNPFIGENSFTQRAVDFPPYRPRTPTGQDPETGEALSAEELRDNDDVTVTYAFTTSAVPETEAAGLGPNDVGDPRAPKTVEVGGGQAVLVRDADVTFRKVLFLGFNEESGGKMVRQAEREGAALAKAVPSYDPEGRTEMVTRISPAGRDACLRQWKNKSVGSWADTVPLPSAARRATLVSMVEKLESGHPHCRYEVRAFAEYLARSEDELRRMADDTKKGKESHASPFKRLVISAHHAPAQGGVYVELFYGDTGMGLLVSELLSFTEAFSTAMAQVEDVCLLSCNTGHNRERPVVAGLGAWEIVPDLAKAFSSVQTIWAYEAKGPSGVAAERDLVMWEDASRKASAAEEIVATSHRLRTGKNGRPGWWSIVWARSGGSVKPRFDSR